MGFGDFQQVHVCHTPRRILPDNLCHRNTPPRDFTTSQNHWKGENCVKFYVSLRLETLQRLWVTCSSVHALFKNK